MAFCIIIGDTIPHVMSALFPSLHDSSVLWILTNRRAIIVIFVMGISYPLSLYRDIAKVCISPFFASQIWGCPPPPPSPPPTPKLLV